MKRFLSLCLTLWLGIAGANAQIVDFKNDQYWLDAGIGQYYTPKEGFISLDLGINLVKTNLAYKVKYSGQYEFGLLSGLNPKEQFHTIGLMIGKYISDKYVHMQISGGLGLMGGVKRSKYLYTENPSDGFCGTTLFDNKHYKKEYFVASCLPIELDITFKPTKYLGAGITFWANLNHIQPMFGFSLYLSAGKLR